VTAFDRSLLRRLAEWDGAGAPITSLSLSVDGRTYPRKTDVEIRVDELIRRARSVAMAMGRDALRSVERDTDAMSGFVRDDFERGGTRGLAMFSSHDAGLWDVALVPRPLMHRAVVGPDADLLPLEVVLETYRPSCLALVDYEKSRLFVVEMGQIEEVAGVTDDVPGRHDQGGRAQMRMQRHVDDHRARHLRHVAERLFVLWRRRRFEHLVLAGPAEAHRELEAELHDYLRQRIRGHAVLPLSATTHQVLDKVLEVEERVERESERDVLERLEAAVGADNGGVVGLEPTLEALANDRVGELVVSHRLSAPGARCLACGRLMTRGSRCSSCGARTERIPDVVEAAVAVAFRTGARVETIVDDDPRPSFDGVGALLRF
jgi:peptide chain release factor subunit 1